MRFPQAQRIDTIKSKNRQRKDHWHELSLLQGKEMHRRVQERQKEEIEEEKEVVPLLSFLPIFII
jgi:hypothetical protein